LKTPPKALLIAAACIALAPAPRLLAQQVLLFDNLWKSDLKVEFHTECSPSTPPKFSQPTKVASTRGLFHISYDPRSEPKNGKPFTHIFFVDTGTGWLSCPTEIDTSGTFLDRHERIHFTIKYGGKADDGSLDLPIHVVSRGNFIDIVPSSTPIKVNVMILPEAESPGLDLRNVLSDIGVIIDSAQISSDNPRNWKMLEIATKIPIRIAPNNPETLRLRLQPNSTEAILATLASIKPDGLHDKLRLSVRNQSDFGGFPRTAQVEIGVRFVPSIVIRAFALIFGSLLGTLTTLLLPNTWKGWRYASKEVLKGLLFSLVADLFAMFLTANGSRFVIFNFDLDPGQVLPTLFIGFVVSGGREVLTYLGFSMTGSKEKAGEVGVVSGNQPRADER